MPKKGSHYVRRNPMRKKLVEAMIAGKSLGTASRIAGYAQPQNAYKALSQMRDRGEMLEELDKLGWTPRDFAKKHLAKMLDRKKTIYFQSDGIVTDKRVVEDTEAQQRAGDMYLRIRGLYAPIEVEHSGTITHELTETEKKEARESLERIRAFEVEGERKLLTEATDD